jgi:hypothetical protein
MRVLFFIFACVIAQDPSGLSLLHRLESAVKQYKAEFIKRSIPKLEEELISLALEEAAKGNTHAEMEMDENTWKMFVIHWKKQHADIRIAPLYRNNKVYICWSNENTMCSLLFVF